MERDSIKKKLGFSKNVFIDTLNSYIEDLIFTPTIPDIRNDFRQGMRLEMFSKPIVDILKSDSDNEKAQLEIRSHYMKLFDRNKNMFGDIFDFALNSEAFVEIKENSKGEKEIIFPKLTMSCNKTSLKISYVIDGKVNKKRSLNINSKESHHEIHFIRFLVSKMEACSFGLILESLLAENERLKKEAETTKNKQISIFPKMTPSKYTNLEKNFALNLGGVPKIREKFKDKLLVKLTSGKTVGEMLDITENWFNNLEGKDLIYWTKVFKYIQTVKNHSENTNTLAVSGELHREVNRGVYIIHVSLDQTFFDFFIPRDKTSNKHTTNSKEHFLRWFYANQKEIEFPLVENDTLSMVPIKIYEYIEQIHKNDSLKTLVLKINTNILETEFKDYISIDNEQMDRACELWNEKLTVSDHSEFKRLKSKFEDMPTRLFYTLSMIYNKKGNYKATKGFMGNKQTIKIENFDEKMGLYKDRLENELVTKRKKAKDRQSPLFKESRDLMLKTIFEIAVDLKWLKSTPSLNNGVYTFNLNRAFFDKANTAKALSKIS